jgi:hypothetical protein
MPNVARKSAPSHRPVLKSLIYGGNAHNGENTSRGAAAYKADDLIISARLANPERSPDRVCTPPLKW